VQAAEGAQHVEPGRSHRWKVLPRMICAPIASSERGITPLTVP
jgi:hypothetical protein